jgi:hypothetical protein
MATLVVLALLAGVTYDIKTSPPIYSDGATMIFYVTRKMAKTPEQINSVDQSLVTTEVMFAQTAPEYVGTTGGKAQIDAFPCNRFNLEYPDYEEQCATLTATAPGAAAVSRGFRLAYRMLKSRLMRLQVATAVRPPDRIRTYLVGISGPQPEQGSRARVFAGLGLLAFIGMLTASRFFEQRGPRTRIHRGRHAG